MHRRTLILLGTLAVTPLLARRRLRAAEPPAEPAAAFESAGHSIPVERFLPPGSGKHPAVMLLYGADGYQNRFFQEIYRRYARLLSENGYAVYLPHYMERTGTRFAGLREMVRDYAPWMKTLGDCVSWIEKQPEADPRRLGVMGLSLGGSLALSNAAMDPRLKVVVDVFGMLPNYFHDRLDKFPPTLILHGTRDPLVPVQKSYDLERMLKEKKRTYELKVYEGQGHGFVGEADQDSRKRIVAFLDRYLKTVK